MSARSLLLLAIMLAVALPATAHEVRPAFLQIRQIDTSTYDILWKTPAQGDLRLALNVMLPAECRDVAEPRTTLVNAAVIQRWRSNCAGGLPGKRIVIEHLQSTLTDVILRFEPLADTPKTLRLNGAAPHAVIPSRQSFRQVAETYFRLGVEHILFGFDHLLFVLCLLILVGDLKRLVGAITAFTLAHSLTLAGTTLGWLNLASVPVEACIALSIAFIAAEIVKARQGRIGVTQRWPWLASLAFGLLHGFGFASALREIGLPDGAVPLALAFFNVGVETGQLMFIAVALAARLGWRTFAAPPPLWAWRIPPYVAGIVACFWFIERTANIFL
jgi:hydrogenase/urease accessory protein HupE